MTPAPRRSCWRSSTRDAPAGPRLGARRGARPPRAAAVPDRGTAPARDAADRLPGLAPRGDTGGGEEAILPLTMAAAVTVWPRLLKLARDARAPGRPRRQAVFWLGQAAGD